MLNALQRLQSIFNKPDRDAAMFFDEFPQNLSFWTVDLFAINLSVRELNALLPEQLLDKSLFFGADDHRLSWTV